MLYCFDQKMDFTYTKNEINAAKLKNSCIFYDNQSEAFVDIYGNCIDINNEIIFPRTGSVQIFHMNEMIKKNGGLPIVSNEEINKILSWPLYYNSYRKVEILKGSDLINDLIIERLVKCYGKELFLKTRNKNFSSVILIDLLKDKECAFYKTLLYHLNDEFIISEKVDIVEDEKGKKEYRCFVIKNEIYNISRMTDNLLHKIDIKVLKKIEQIIKGISDIFPSSYVIDVFEYYNDDQIIIDVVEFNPIHASGIYLYNSVMKKSDDLLHDNIEDISGEFSDQIYKCSVNGSVIDDRQILYDIPNSFSSDLRSICLTGNRGLLFSEAILSTEDFAKHSAIYNFNELDLIESDEQLSDEQVFGSFHNSELSNEQQKMLQKLLKLNKK